MYLKLKILTLISLCCLFNANHAFNGLTEKAFVDFMQIEMSTPEISDPSHPDHDLYFGLLNYTVHSYLPLDFLKTGAAATPNISKQCSEDIGRVIVNLTDPWALQFLDAWGKPAAGLFQGASKWTGAYQQCMGLSSSVFNQTSGNNTYPYDFVGRYCNVYIGSAKQKASFATHAVGGAVPGLAGIGSIALGACVPDSCSLIDIWIFMETVLYKISNNTIAVKYVDTQPSSRESPTLTTAAIGMICALSFLGFLMLLGTLYDVLIYQPSLEHQSSKLKEMTVDEGAAVNPENGLANNPQHLRGEDYTPLVNDENTVEIKQKVTAELVKLPAKLFICFSIYTNGSKVIHIGKTTEVNLSAVHGIRVVSMFWVILGHVFTFTMSPVPQEYMIIKLPAKLFLCFSIYTNGSKVVTIGKAADANLSAVHGIRVLSMFWVILGHAFAFVNMPGLTMITMFYKFLLCFSILINGSKVLAWSRPSRTNLSAIHGIRLLSMFWVILGHSYYFPLKLQTVTAMPLKLILCFSVLMNGSKVLAITKPSNSNLSAVHGIRLFSMCWVILGHSLVFTISMFIRTMVLGFGSGALLSFSVLSNATKILSVGNIRNDGKQDTSTLHVVHGIRFLSMSWVILGHTLFFPNTLGAIKNIAIAGDLLKRFTFQALIGATVSVDSFFLLSGTLIAYLSLREMKAKEGPRKVNWALYYFHRFWRLTPPYMLVLGSYAALINYAGSGPYWPAVNMSANCTWWTNLLYINNIVEPDKMCIGWSWFLANDMQFFVITPLILIPMFFSGIAGTAITMGLMLASFIATGVISSTHHYLPGMQGQISPLAQSPAFANHSQADFFNQLYIPPYTRIGPYLVGVLLGYILYKTDRKIKMHWAVALLGWIIASFCLALPVYGLWGVVKGTATMSNGVSALFNAVHRSVWGVGLAWVIFACSTGYGGFVNTILSWQALVPLSRLTYMAYLVHPAVIIVYTLQLQQPIIYDDFTFIYLFLANLVMSYMVAFVTTLAFESPMMALEKLIFGRFR